MNNGDCTVVTVGHETRCEHVQPIVFLDSITCHHYHNHQCRVLSMTSVARGTEVLTTECKPK
jgi:hypothetical protein